MTQLNYPGLLDRDAEINFALKYRQLIELIGGTQGEMEKYNGEKTDTICNGNINAIKEIGLENFFDETVRPFLLPTKGILEIRLTENYV